MDKDLDIALTKRFIADNVKVINGLIDDYDIDPAIEACLRIIESAIHLKKIMKI